MAPIVPNVKGQVARLTNEEVWHANRTLRNAAKNRGRKVNRRANWEKKRMADEAYASTLPPKPITDQGSNHSEPGTSNSNIPIWKQATKAAALASLSPTGTFILGRAARPDRTVL